MAEQGNIIVTFITSIDQSSSYQIAPPKLVAGSSYRSLTSQASTQLDAPHLPKSYVCAECGKSFPRHGRLGIHERTHVALTITYRLVKDLTNVLSRIVARSSARKEI